MAALERHFSAWRREAFTRIACDTNYLARR
jgi:hypothetical protein